MNFDSIKRTLNGFLVALTIFMASPPAAMAFVADTTSLNGSLTGLWNNADQPGWGTAITHQYGMIFATFYTYDHAGNPTWYVASACPVSGSGCTGPLYTVTGGTNPIDTWNAPNKIVTQVGTMTFTFTDANTGTMSYSINGSNGTKTITKSVFASPPGGVPFGSLTITNSSKILYVPGTLFPTNASVVTENKDVLSVAFGEGFATGLAVLISKISSGNPSILIQFVNQVGFNSVSLSCSNGISLQSGYLYPYAENCSGFTFDLQARTVTLSNVKLQVPNRGEVITMSGRLPY